MSTIKDTIAEIEREFGRGSIMELGADNAIPGVEAISTGSLKVDRALGIGGMPRGRIVEVFGPESSGKTTLVLQTIACGQAMDLRCAFIDAEHALDKAYAEALGVNSDDLLVSQPDYGEQALQIADMLVRSGHVGIVAIDSVAALTPKAELDGEMGDVTVGAQARMMSQAMRKLAAMASRNGVLLIFTNQIREKIGVMFGSPETQPGGRALKFYASQRLDVRRISTEGKKGEQTHNMVRVKVVKNKVAPPFREAEVELVFGVGIDGVGELLDEGIDLGLVKKSGAWFSFDDTGEAKAQGRAAAKEHLAGLPDLMDEIRSRVA